MCVCVCVSDFLTVVLYQKITYQILSSMEFLSKLYLDCSNEISSFFFYSEQSGFVFAFAFALFCFSTWEIVIILALKRKKKDLFFFFSFSFFFFHITDQVIN